MKKLAFILACIMLVMSFSTLTAFAANDTVTITFRTSDGSLQLINAEGRLAAEIVIERERGYILTAEDYPKREARMPDPNQYEWETDLIGTAINEDVVIVLHVTRDTSVYTVTFYDWDNNVLERQQVLSGAPAMLPKLEDRDGIMVVDWYIPPIVLDNGYTIDKGTYRSIHEDVDIYPVPALRGDANNNDMLDVGDATLILRASLLSTTQSLDFYSNYARYDFNKNNSVDAGDATGVLRATVGLK